MLHRVLHLRNVRNMVYLRSTTSISCTHYAYGFEYFHWINKYPLVRWNSASVEGPLNLKSSTRFSGRIQCIQNYHKPSVKYGQNVHLRLTLGDLDLLPWHNFCLERSWCIFLTDKSIIPAEMAENAELTLTLDGIYLGPRKKYEPWGKVYYVNR